MICKREGCPGVPGPGALFCGALCKILDKKIRFTEALIETVEDPERATVELHELHMIGQAINDWRDTINALKDNDG